MGLYPRLTPTGRQDDGDIVLSWLFKVTVVLVIVGITLFDAISVTVTRLRTSDDASAAASAASESWQRSGSRDLQGSYDAAAQLARSQGELIPTTSFRVDPDGTVHLRVRSTASTLVLHRLPPLAGLTRVDVAGSGRALLS